MQDPVKSPADAAIVLLKLQLINESRFGGRIQMTKVNGELGTAPVPSAESPIPPSQTPVGTDVKSQTFLNVFVEGITISQADSWQPAPSLFSDHAQFSTSLASVLDLDESVTPLDQTIHPPVFDSAHTYPTIHNHDDHAQVPSNVQLKLKTHILPSSASSDGSAGLKLAQLRAEEDHNVMQDMEVKMAAMQKELDQLKAESKRSQNERFRIQRIGQIIAENSKCPICQDICILPVVLGTCGHHMCERCLGAYDTASQRRVCPTCRSDIIGSGFPVVAFNSIITTLIETRFMEADEALLRNGFRIGARMPYPKKTAPHMHTEALRIAQWAQTRLGTFGAVHAVATTRELAQRLGPADPFLIGVLFDFEPSTSLQFVDVVARLLISRYNYFVARIPGRATLVVMAKSSIPAVSAVANGLAKLGEDVINSRLCIRIRADGHVHPLGQMSLAAAALPSPEKPLVPLQQVNPMTVSAADATSAAAASSNSEK
jgi:hypothetical protein